VAEDALEQALIIHSDVPRTGPIETNVGAGEHFSQGSLVGARPARIGDQVGTEYGVTLAHTGLPHAGLTHLGLAGAGIPATQRL
jgi:hypothetical protein